MRNEQERAVALWRAVGAVECAVALWRAVGLGPAIAVGRAVSVESGDDGAPTGERLDHGRRNALGGEDLLQVASREYLVAGRVDALDPDQVAQQLNELRQLEVRHLLARLVDGHEHPPRW